MSAAPLAFAAGACGVLAAWELAGAAADAAVVARAARAVDALRGGPAGRTPAQERRLLVVLGAAGLAAGLLLAGPAAALVGAAGTPWAAARAAAWRREREGEELAAGAPAAARSIADALTAGHAVRGALAEAARAGGCGPVTDRVLRAAAGALAVGAPTERVIEGLRDRGGGPAWDTVAAAILLQREAGGDLAGLLRAIATDLEAARRAEADARTATAQARATARIVGVLPLLAAGVGELAAPGTIGRMLGSPLTAACPVAAAGLEALALVLVRRLARPEAGA